MEICAESQGEFPSAVLPGAVLSGLFLFCILGHSGEAESLVYDTLRAVAGTLSLFFALSLSLPPSLSVLPYIHFPILQNYHWLLSIPLMDTM